ncbi:MAG: hypothetical protein RSE07_02145, partial [Oscillospiraceae bacterium]
LKGLGDAAAYKLMEASTQGKYISVDEIISKSGVSKTVIEGLDSVGALEGIPKTSQITFFG